jgi:hypothetical protein
LIIVCFVKGFRSGGGAAIVPAVVMAIIRTSKIERAHDQAAALVHLRFLP